MEALIECSCLVAGARLVLLGPLFWGVWVWKGVCWLWVGVCARCWVLEFPLCRPWCLLGAGGVSNQICLLAVSLSCIGWCGVVGGWLLFENCIVDASIL